MYMYKCIVPNVSHLFMPVFQPRPLHSCADCLEDKGDYQNYSVLCCVQQLCTMICRHTVVHMRSVL